MSGDGTKELMGRVELGIETETFIAGPIGSYLLERLRDEEKRAIEELKRVDPHDTGKIVELQYLIKRSENIDGWLAGLIQEGWYAEKQLKEEDA